MNLGEVPDITVPLSTGGYIGYTLLGILALAILIVGALTFPASTGFGLLISGVGAVTFIYAAFPYLRTVEMGWHWPNVLVWVGLLGSGVLATIATHYIDNARGGYIGAATFFPLLGAGAGAVVAGIFDALNEVLGGIPLSWGAAIVLVLVVTAFVFEKAR